MFFAELARNYEEMTMFQVIMMIAFDGFCVRLTWGNTRRNVVTSWPFDCLVVSSLFALPQLNLHTLVFL